MGTVYPSFMPRIDAQGNIVPDGTRAPPPELPRGAGLWVVLLLLVACAACACTVPSRQSFEHHIQVLQAEAIEQAVLAMNAAGGGTPGGMFGLFGVHGVGALRAVFAELAGSILPKSYERRDYWILCVYVLGGEKHDDVLLSKGIQVDNQHWMGQLTTTEEGLSKMSLSTKYVG